MKDYIDIIKGIVLFGLLVVPLELPAQSDDGIAIEQSAEVFLEEYSDAFQELFFEALKQKGIGNYDRAINLFLECKQLEPDNDVLDHELARSHLLDKKNILAQEYAQSALLARPTNYWYARTWIRAGQGQGAVWEQAEASLPMQNEALRKNLALAYTRQKEYKRALVMIKGLPASDFSRELAAKINDFLKGEKSVTAQKKGKNSQEPTVAPVEDPLAGYKSRIGALIASNDLAALEPLANEAADRYPTQPYFQYAKGWVLNKKGKHKQAIGELEAALDLILDDVSLTNKIYGELAQAHTALGSTSKANMYLRKIKPGF